ncbi:MAG: 4Fe-4S dicluster domain-containing protein [Deltaproteobacteria bacterium]|nr:4Fe-4S dicluster domain-containing protein [Deltaproteobacteria bacterium]
MSARTREGRVVKLEGNPEHPIGRGALCVRGQAAIEGLYHPERLGGPMLRAQDGSEQSSVTWDAAEAALGDALSRAIDHDAPIYVLTRPEPGALGGLFGAWLTALGQQPDQQISFDPLEPTWTREAGQRTFAASDRPNYRLGRARMLLSIGADFLEDWGSPVEHARGLADMQAGRREGETRFVYVGPRLSLTAAAADRWLSVRPGSEIHLVLGLARYVLEQGGAGVSSLPGPAAASLARKLAGYTPQGTAERTGLDASDITSLGRQLVRARPSLVLGPGRSVAGSNAVALASAVHVLNALTGAIGDTVRWPQRVEETQQGAESELTHLVERARRGRIGVLVVHHTDPLRFGAAFDQFERALEQVDFLAVIGHRLDGLARRANVVLPDHHFLESWSTLETRPGVMGIQQPTMTPLLETKAAADVLIAAARSIERADGLPYGTFAESIHDEHDPQDLQRGGVFEQAPLRVVSLTDDPLPMPLEDASLEGPDDGLALSVFPSLRQTGDGRPADDLLSEIPDPLTLISWSGWVELHPATAATLGLATRDVVRVDAGQRQLELPVYVHPGVREGIAGIPAPFATDLLTSGAQPALGLVSRVSLSKTGAVALLPRSQTTENQAGRELAMTTRELTARGRHVRRLSMYPTPERGAHRWGLVVDLDRCNGCSSCVAACYVENNSAIVGPEETANRRTMNWMRIERFMEGSPEHPDARFMPAMCQQCTNAPCESVCPVYATYHTSDGINGEIYNRCVGTRYCENNCPYQARRFNWYDRPRSERARLALNPDVTVRERGVTEKCTFCIQRIRAGKEQAKIDGKPILDGDITPACAQTCPTGALVFGDLQDPASRVSRLAAGDRAYHLFEELNTIPGVVYLARRRVEIER